MSSYRMNFSKVRALIVDSDPYAARLLAQILRGFGLTLQTVAKDGASAKRDIETAEFDLIICEAVLPDMSAAELLRWIRRHDRAVVKFTPIVILTGYTHLDNIKAARDSGANNVVKKPVSPAVLLDHIVWSARSPRPFIETSSFIGPDRRFKFTGPPEGIGRRDNDLTPEVGDATAPNMSQEEIDSLLKPNKVEVL